MSSNGYTDRDLDPKQLNVSDEKNEHLVGDIKAYCCVNILIEDGLGKD